MNQNVQRKLGLYRSGGLNCIIVPKLNLMVHTENFLMYHGVANLAQLMDLSEEKMSSWRNFGKASVQEVLSLQKEVGEVLREVEERGTSGHRSSQLC